MSLNLAFTPCIFVISDLMINTAKRLKQDKLAAFNYMWSLFIQNCKTQFSLGAFTTVDKQLVPFRG